MENIGQQTTSMLEQFCYDGDDRPYLARPFSLGQHTYATNGHIMVRVPVVEALGPPNGAPEGFEEALGKILKEPDGVKYFKLPHEKIPPKPDDVECPICRGTGHEHHCPDCRCECFRCLGLGKINPEDGVVSVTVNRIPFAAPYIRMIADLPDPRMSRPRRGEHPVHFKFGESGFGALMPQRSALAIKIPIKLGD